MESKLDLRILEIAASVVECGSMTVTARRFGITQSAVSQAIRRVEGVLGSTIVRRDQRPMVATGAGQVLAEQVSRLAREVSRSIGAIRVAAQQAERLELRLGLIDTIAGAIGAPLIKRLRDDSIAIRLSAWSGLVSAHSDALIHNTIDAAITTDPLKDIPDLVRFPLMREPFVLLAPHPLAASLRDLPLAEVLHYTLVRHSARSAVGMQVERHLRRVGVEVPWALELDGSDVLLAMVAFGAGVAITTPLCVLQGAQSAGKVQVMRLPGVGFTRELMLVTRRATAELGGRVAELTRELLRDHALPRIHALIPWLAGHPDLCLLPDPGSDAQRRRASPQDP